MKLGERLCCLSVKDFALCCYWCVCSLPVSFPVPFFQKWAFFIEVLVFWCLISENVTVLTPDTSSSWYFLDLFPLESWPSSHFNSPLSNPVLTISIVSGLWVGFRVQQIFFFFLARVGTLSFGEGLFAECLLSRCLRTDSFMVLLLLAGSFDIHLQPKPLETLSFPFKDRVLCFGSFCSESGFWVTFHCLQFLCLQRLTLYCSQLGHSLL